MGESSNTKRTRSTSGCSRHVKVDRIGRVSIYRRGRSYYLYFREHRKSVRRQIDGNLATARATASKVNASLEEGSPSPFGFRRVSIEDLIAQFLSHCDELQGLALRTLDRYRAALEHFIRFVRSKSCVSTAEEVSEATVEDFLRWLRQQSRARNGAKSGEQDRYTASGIRFILCVCRTAFNWARRRHYLPPYSENPFSALPIDKTFRNERAKKPPIFTPDQERQFFEECDDWQRPIFLVLAVYGLRVGELTHLLVSDVDFDQGLFVIRSKTEMFWSVKTERERRLPLLPEVEGLFRRLSGDRRDGFFFMNRDFVAAKTKPRESFRSPRALTVRLQELAERARAEGADGQREIRRRIVEFLRQIGQIPEKRLRQEFMKITKKIGCPEITRVHSLRHLFASRAMERQVNPLLVRDILGHTTLEMTSRYTQFSLEAKRREMSELTKGHPFLGDLAGS